MAERIRCIDDPAILSQIARIFRQAAARRLATQEQRQGPDAPPGRAAA